MGTGGPTGQIRPAHHRSVIGSLRCAANCSPLSELSLSIRTKQLRCRSACWLEWQISPRDRYSRQKQQSQSRSTPELTGRNYLLAGRR